MRDDDEVMSWLKHIINASNIVGRESRVGPKLEQWVKDTGFINVVHRKFKIPLGSWPREPFMKQLGTWSRANLLDGLEGFSLRLMCEVLKWKPEEVEVMLAGVRKRLMSPDCHGYYAL